MYPGIIQTTKEDLFKIAECHKKAFPSSLSSQLGSAYCIKMFSFYLEDNRAFLFHQEIDNKIIGYCGGLMRKEPQKPGSATSIIQYTFSKLIISLLKRPWLLLHPEIIANTPLIFRNIRQRIFGDFGKSNHSVEKLPESFIASAGLVVIGVLPEYQGKGYGSTLLRVFEERAIEMGFKRIHLSVKKTNHKAITAYQRNGWIVSNEGKNDISMHKDL